MHLVGTTRGAFRDYIADQLDNFFPDKASGTTDAVERNLDEALTRVQRCVDAAQMWTPGQFDYLQTSQYMIFLYFLANTIWRNKGDERVCTKLFYLNKALNGIDCFYKIKMPDIWFVGHSVGIVFADATYGNYLVAYQNSTVGKNHGKAPILGEGVVLFPNSAIVGNCTIGPRTFLAQGQSIVDQDTPGDCTVFSEGGKLILRKPSRDILADFFRL